MAVRHERTHTPLFRKSLRIVVAVFGHFQIRWVLKYCDVRDEAQRMGLVTAKLPLPCQVQCNGGNSLCVRDTVCGQVGIAEPGGPERFSHPIFCGAFAIASSRVSIASSALPASVWARPSAAI